jgi:hypothetical protein
MDRADILSLSSRQKSLLKRLSKICDRTLNEQLPIVVEEIWGFGSFLRGKERPGDIDLVIKYSKEVQSFEIFKHLTKGIVKRYGYSEHRPETPADALTLLVLELKVKGIDIVTEQDLATYLGWLEGITWKMVFREMNPELFAYDPSGITKRRLLRGIREIHIMSVTSVGSGRGILVAKEYELFWSKSNPDLNFHVSMILSPDRIGSTCINELQNFEGQLEKLMLQLQVLQRMFMELRETDEDFGTIDERDKWLLSTGKRIFSQCSIEVLSEILHSFKIDTEKLGVVQNFNPAHFSALPLKELQLLVETKRAEVKNAQEKLKVLRYAFFSLKDLKVHNERSSPVSIDVRIAWDTLENVQKAVVEESKIRAYLRELDIPEHEIKTIKERGSKIRFRPFKF